MPKTKTPPKIAVDREVIDEMSREVTGNNQIFTYKDKRMQAQVRLALRPIPTTAPFVKLGETLDPDVVQESGVAGYDRLCLELKSTYIELAQAGPVAVAALITYTDSVSGGGNVQEATAELHEARERVAELKEQVSALLAATKIARSESLAQLSGLIDDMSAQRRGDFKAEFDREVLAFRDAIADKLPGLALAKSNYERSLGDKLKAADLLDPIPLPEVPQANDDDDEGGWIPTPGAKRPSDVDHALKTV